MIKNTKIELLRNLIAEDDISQAIKELRSNTHNLPKLRNEILLLSSRYERLTQQSSLDMAGADILNQETNRIKIALLSIIDRLPQNEATRTRKIIVWLVPIVATIVMVLVLAFFVKSKTELPISKHQNDTNNPVDTSKVIPPKNEVEPNSTAHNEMQSIKNEVKPNFTAHNDVQLTKNEERQITNGGITEHGQKELIPIDTSNTPIEKIENKGDSETGKIKLYIDGEQEGEDVYINGKRIDGISQGVIKTIDLPMHKEYFIKIGHCKEKKIYLEKKSQREFYTCQN